MEPQHTHTHTNTHFNKGQNVPAIMKEGQSHNISMIFLDTFSIFEGTIY